MIWSEIRAQGWKYGAYALVILLIAATAYGVWQRGSAAVARESAGKAKSEARASKAAMKAAQAITRIERVRVADANKVAEQYENEKIEAEHEASRLADALRSGTVQLQKRWRCPAVPAVGADSGKPNGESDDRAESASRAIRAADEADAKIRALQEFVRKEREQ